MTKICIIIPARYEASRFPGKLLETVHNCSILQHVYLNCLSCELVSKVLVATDHEKIAEHCKEQKMDFVMTKDHHLSGTDRVAEAISLLDMSFDIIINVQGDEPLLRSRQINQLISLMLAKSCDIATLYKVGRGPKNNNSNSVKLVQDINKRVMYFSRSSLPFYRDEEAPNFIKMHLGIYAFKPEVLKKVTDLAESKLEQVEKLEQLRWLENGFQIYATEVDYDGFGIDTREDLERMRLVMPRGD